MLVHIIEKVSLIIIVSGFGVVSGFGGSFGFRGSFDTFGTFGSGSVLQSTVPIISVSVSVPVPKLRFGIGTTKSRPEWYRSEPYSGLLTSLYR